MLLSFYHLANCRSTISGRITGTDRIVRLGARLSRHAHPARTARPRARSRHAPPAPYAQSQARRTARHARPASTVLRFPSIQVLAGCPQVGMTAPTMATPSATSNAPALVTERAATVPRRPKRALHAAGETSPRHLVMLCHARLGRTIRTLAKRAPRPAFRAR